MCICIQEYMNGHVLPVVAVKWKSEVFVFVRECVVHACARACVRASECVSSLSHWLMGTRRIHAEELPGACSQAVYMETVRNCYVSRLRRSLSLSLSLLFHSHTCALLSKVHLHTHICSLNMPTFFFFFFFFSLRCSFLHTFISNTLITHCSKVASAQHSTLFHASLRMTDSKQHFLPFFFHGKLLSLYNPLVWQPPRPTILLCLSPLSHPYPSLTQAGKNLGSVGWEAGQPVVASLSSMSGQQGPWYKHVCPIFPSCRCPPSVISAFMNPSSFRHELQLTAVKWAK